MAKDEYEAKSGSKPSYPGGKFSFAPIQSPKEHESGDGVLHPTGDCLPDSATPPHK